MIAGLRAAGQLMERQGRRHHADPGDGLRTGSRWSGRCKVKPTEPPGFGICRSAATRRPTKLPAPPCFRWTTARRASLPVRCIWCRHFGLEGRRHGGGRASAVSGNETTGCQARRFRRPPRGHRRANRDHSAEPCSHYDRFGDRRLVAGRGAGDHAVGAGVVALPRRGPQSRHARDGRRDRCCFRSRGRWAFTRSIMP